MRTVLAGFLVLVILVGGYFAFNLNQVSNSQDDLSDAADSANLQSCEETKRSVCNLKGSIKESDYSENCFENGENILENPYECPG